MLDSLNKEKNKPSPQKKKCRSQNTKTHTVQCWYHLKKTNIIGSKQDHVFRADKNLIPLITELQLSTIT
jgi:hypothetical protein